MQFKEDIQQDYTYFSSGYQLSLNMDIQIYIPKNDPVRLLNQLLEGLNYTKLLSTYSDKGRKSAVPPIILFQILVYAYMNRTFSSREIEKLCQRDLHFIWLLRGYPAPFFMIYLRREDLSKLGKYSCNIISFRHSNEYKCLIYHIE